jgi:alpha-L-fucosidase
MGSTPPNAQHFPRRLDPEAIDDRRDVLLAGVSRSAASGPFTADPASLAGYRVPDWFTRAKFGIFVHWLPASVPAHGNEWYARSMYLDSRPESAYHVATYGPQSEFGFKDFLPQFTGSSFDADAWIELVKRAGARYIVPVAEHHDGYALYDTCLSRWKAPLIGPGRDVIAELAAAARRAGVRFGLSSHRAEHWWFFNGGTRFASDVNDPEWADLYGPAKPLDSEPDRDFLDDWLARTAELVELYEPDIVYFDWWIEQPAFRDDLRRFAAYYYNHAARRGAEAIISYKWDAFEPGSAVTDIERGNVRGIQPRPFQNDTATSRITWCYMTENDFKPLEDLVADLVDTVSKNGCLLLNIGPAPDGSIPAEDRALLEGIGDWLAVNGEAIYDTSPWLVYGEGPTQIEGGSFADEASLDWTSRDIRFTCSGDTLYAIILRWPEDGTVAIRTLGTDLRLIDAEIASVELLGSAAPTSWHRGWDALHVTLPASSAPSAVGACLRIKLVPFTPPERNDEPLDD